MAVVAALVKAHPDGAKKTTTNVPRGDGWLPLHLAVENQASVAVVEALLEAHKDAAGRKATKVRVA